MNTKKEIIYNNKKEIIERLPNECVSRFNSRINFIKSLEKTDLIWKDVIKISKIWQNINFYKIKYNPVIIPNSVKLLIYKK
jgi:hypothetical protein